MRTRTVGFSVAMLCVCLLVGAQDTESSFKSKLAHDKAFLPVYSSYINTIKTQGVAGLKALATPDFMLKWDNEKRTGAAAFSELQKYISAPSKGDPIEAFAVTLRRLTFVGDRAIVQTEEKVNFRPLASGNEPSSMYGMSWLWKQTWRKTPQGWKLAGWERGTKKLSPNPWPLTYTVKRDWKNADAATPETSPASPPESPTPTPIVPDAPSKTQP